MNQRRLLLITITGPSAVGKDSVLKGLGDRELGLTSVVTATTRAPRDDEEHGVAYHFLSEEEFERRVQAGEFLEHALVHGDRKGVLKASVREALERGEDVVLQVDVQGADTIRQLVPDTLTVFIKPESLESLAERRQRRGSMSAEDFERREADAREELARAGEFDYVVVNRDGALEATLDEIEAIIRRERERADRQPPTIPD
ncbi:MAG: guanylate kinase [Dehalococcoidia bacterium]